jgi:hypothetical protein
MQQVSVKYQCWLHFQNSCVLNLASAACYVKSLPIRFATCDNLQKELWISSLAFRSWHTLIWFCFHLSISRWGTESMAFRNIFISCVETFWHDPNESPTSLARLSIVTHPFTWTCSLIHSAFSSILLINKSPECSTLSADFTPSFDRENQ